MNPSAPDWILKFLNRFDRNTLANSFKNEVDFYCHLKDTGFIFGVSFRAIPSEALSHLKLTREEFTKVNLFHALLFTLFQQFPNVSNEEAILKMIGFYKELEKGKTGFFHKLSLSQKPPNVLENIFTARLQETNSLFKKNTVALLTHALLYLDVLAFEHWLKNPELAKSMIKKTEASVLESCYLAMKEKSNRNKYEILLIELFENSQLYSSEKSSVKPFANNENNRFSDFGFFEKKYILDLCCLTIWEDGLMEKEESDFLKKLISQLEFNEKELEKSLAELKSISEKQIAKIHLFEYAHPVKQFYKQSSATVKLLILRNKDRLLKEISKSGELLILLGQSTTRDLSTHEKKKVREQLLDICKSIPSLTIFLLPGGGLMLPLLVKFIPKMLPSAFHDNRIETGSPKPDIGSRNL